MKNEVVRERTSIRSLLMGTSVFASIITLFAAAPLAHAQDADAMETVIITGYRASLQSAAVAKRGAANFTDSVFAEDIGKFPDLNIAEAINRIPGVRLTRDGTGEGTQIVVRGLGPSFTQVLMNGHPISVATDGALGTGNQNREVDLDMFPVELFTKIAVSKTPTAAMFEGGIAGSVNMGTALPLDNAEEGFHLNYSLQEQYNNNSGAFSPRGAFIARQNWNNKLGILIGVATQHLRFRNDSYESTSNALAAVVDQQPAGSCPNCNTIGTGKNFRWATIVPAGVASNPALGIGAVGTPYTYSGGVNTAGGTSGLSTTDLSNAIFPYLASPVLKVGSKNRLSVLGDVQYRPSENLEFNIVALYEYSQRNYDDMRVDWYVRNSCNQAGTDPSCMIPVNVQTDGLHYLTSGTFLNSRFFAMDQYYRENVAFLDINPTVDWTPTSWLKIHGSVDYNDSFMNRREWAYLTQTKLGSGYAVDYSMSPGQDIPTIKTNVPLADPSSNAWEWYQVRVQPLFRDTVDKGTEWNAVLGDETTNLKLGYAYGQHYRYINARDNGTMAQRCVMGASTASALCTLPDGTVLPAGAAALVPNSQLAGYLDTLPTNDFFHLGDGSAGFTNWVIMGHGLDDPTKIRGFVDTAPFTPTGAQGGQKSGAVRETTQNAFVEANTVVQLLDRDMHLNGGLRYYNTNQVITGPVNQNGTYVQYSNYKTYEGVLPSFNISAEVWDNVVFRAAGSQTMTRAQPAAMLPGIAFSSALLSPVTAGNPNLQPYLSTNMDLGAEWYTGGPGVIAVNFFRKDISNFTTTQTITEPFSATGIPISVLTPTQIADYNANGGPNATVSVTTTVNLQQKLHIEGFEINYVQPLDMLIEGSGLTATYTRLTQHVDAGLSVAEAQGLASGITPYTFNLGAYYENEDVSFHVTYNYVARFISGSTPFSQNIMQPEYTEAYGQLDFSASYTIPWLKDTPLDGAQLTLDALNLTQARQRTYIGSTNSPNSLSYPGMSVLIGLRGNL